ncbi:MAG: hypothetical protein HY265_00015 [Deltaproteobacteria bacterium]|nr:hypothetical protein [Deltaproteobacteria bacterium]
MNDKLVDTNILVYSYDTYDAIKHQRAEALIQERWLHADGVLSIQNLSEFYAIITSKVKNPLEPETARGIIHDTRGFQKIPGLNVINPFLP